MWTLLKKLRHWVSAEAEQCFACCKSTAQKQSSAIEPFVQIDVYAIALNPSAGRLPSIVLGCLWAHNFADVVESLLYTACHTRQMLAVIQHMASVEICHCQKPAIDVSVALMHPVHASASTVTCSLPVQV